MTTRTLYRRNFLLHLQERPAYDGPVLLKEPAHEQLTGAQIGQLHNEYAISRELEHVSGVRPVFGIEGSESRPIILLKYIKGQSLAEVIQTQTLDTQQKLQLAVEITGILGDVHKNGVMHRDISSNNIIVSGGTVQEKKDGVTLIDFGLAATLRQEDLAQPVTADVGVGTLAYISPEQTGRMNRAVDYRSDLYSLGVTLYELFTGQVPFQADDTMGMIHAHMAVEPVPPRERNAELPKTLSDIILKLLAKNAEDRYQSPLGLGADLEECLNQWRRSGAIEPFELGQNDFAGRLQIPQKLYGRQAEIAQLAAAYDRVVQGNTELLYVAGYSGVGKTALVHEIRREVLVRQGIFIEGKFEQLQRNQPYSAWAQTLTQLVDNWLAQSETIFASWRETILDAVGENGQVLIDINPTLERIIGPQPPVPKLGGIENQNRLNYTFNRFISRLARPEHPLVVFLDDLQWIDPGSLNLIESLIAVQSTSSLLIIGAYRDNEVGPEHPLIASRERMSSEEDRVKIITLTDLEPDELDHLLADTLQTATDECRDLSQALLEKTAGNPFFYRQQLHALESEQLLSFDRQQRRWKWEDNLQQYLQTSGNVADLMISKIRTLPVETQQTVSMAACLGNRFETSTLSTIMGQDKSEVLTSLSPALQAGLINLPNDYFSFVHDRIQEAGYAMIPVDNLPQTHLEIGRLIHADTAAEVLDEKLFTIVGHLNAGRALIDNEAEKIELAELNLAAGQKAKSASAFSDAKRYIEIGIDLLGSESWREHYELTLSLHNENGALASLTGQYNQIAPIVNLIRANAKSIYDQMNIYMTQIEAETAQYNFAEALKIGLDLLRILGVEFPEQPTGEDIQRINENLLGLLTTEPIERVAGLGEMTDETYLAACSLFAALMSTAYIVNPPLLPMMAFLGATFTMEYGLNAWAPLSFGNIPMLAFASINPDTPADEASKLIQFNRQLVEATRQMIDNPVTAPSRTKGLMMLAFVTPWIEPIEKGIELAQTTYQNGFETGDLLYASYGAYHFAMQGFAAGMNLDLYQSQLSKQRDNLVRVGQKTTPQYLSIYLQTAQIFQKTSPEPDKLNGTYLNEDEWLPAAQAAKDLPGLHNFSINKLMLMYHFDLDEALAGYAGDVEDFLSGGSGFFSVPLIYLYLALAKLRLIEGNSSKDHSATMNFVNKTFYWMEIWSQSVPSSFSHKVDLIAAEKARVTGDLEGALSHYESAISGAQESSFTHEEALANELYARFWADRGNDRFAGQFMREAHSLYRKWGALAKAEHLEKRYPNWLVSRRIILDELHAETTKGQISSNLDILTILKASQAIAGEIELGRLLVLLMNTAIENSGAQSGYLLLPKAGVWMIAAQADIDDSKPQVEQLLSITDSSLLSQGIVNYVARTQQTVLLDEAIEDGDYIGDPHIQRHEVKSLLCTPLVNQGKISAILYLENNLSPGVFIPERIELLNLLSSQIAISIDNARLMEERAQALRSAETQIRSLFEKSPVGIALSNYRGKILTFNKAVLDMLRISEEELLREGAVNFYANSADRAKLLAMVQESGSVQKFGIPLLRKDGELFFGSINMSQFILEGNEVLLVMVEDVTDEIMAEQEAAVLEERERLARDLHDSVTQTLFSASVLAQAAPRLLDKNPAAGRQNIDQLGLLIRGALAEMRSLLFELRPSEFTERSLSQMFELLAESARARTRANVTLDVQFSCSPPEDVAITYYRIAQESLNNVAKHALASEVEISCICDDEGTSLSIKDNGRGFAPSAIPIGHMGLVIMRERAKKIGAKINIDSQAGSGTSVNVSWSAVGKDSALGEESEYV